MRIDAIRANQAMNPLPSPRFAEGARTTAQKVVSFIAAAIASVASFFLLPAQAALLVTGGIGLLLSTIFCVDEEEGAPEQRRWYQPIIHAGPRLVDWVFNAHPVIQPGPRVLPGAGHVHPVLVQGVREQERAPVGRGHEQHAALHPALPHANAVPVLPIRQPGGQHEFPQGRVPVGHGHR
ncbi:MAG: hypothetical protein K1X28_00915 [Parachlamydiales bacterium]|nr:hypothetical protein [Parachlamydiales bacterium]